MKHKWQQAYRVSRFLRLIPTIELVAVTGNVAMNNAEKHDDIDLLCIVSEGTMWVSRLLATLVIELAAKRRRPAMRDVTDAICLNMFLATDALSAQRQDRDLFYAHEALQMVPVWDRGGVYRMFLAKNRWISEILPTAWHKRYERAARNKSYTSWVRSVCVRLCHVVERPARIIQLWYMQKHKTTEIIRPGELRFHPHDARVWVREEYGTRLSKYNIPLDKFFPHG